MTTRFVMLALQLLMLALLMFQGKVSTFSLRRLLAFVSAAAAICAIYRSLPAGAAFSLSFALILIVNAILLKPTNPRRAKFLVVFAIVAVVLSIGGYWIDTR